MLRLRKVKAELVSKILLILFFGELVQAHGENVYGPNGGFVRMPGAFHTEVVPIDESHFKLYLLDVKWENPSNINSKLNIALRQYEKLIILKCEAKTNFYVCELPEKMKLNAGQLEVNAQRDGQKGRPVIYKLPLKLEK